MAEREGVANAPDSLGARGADGERGDEEDGDELKVADGLEQQSDAGGGEYDEEVQGEGAQEREGKLAPRHFRVRLHAALEASEVVRGGGHGVQLAAAGRCLALGLALLCWAVVGRLAVHSSLRLA